MLADRNTSILGAGDDDQSIYLFRKAAPEGIRRFPEDYPGCADYPLSVTQRCAQKIVIWANHVISGDTGRIAGRPPLTALSSAPQGDVGLLSFRDQRAEPKGIADLVQHLVHDEHLVPSDILILLRSDHNDSFSRPIREEIEARDIPCSDPEVVNRILAEEPNRYFIEMLRLLVDPNDSLAWASLLALTPGLGATTQSAIYNKAVERHMRFGETLLAMRAQGFVEVSGAQRRKILSLTGEVMRWLAAHSLPEESPDDGWGQWMIGASTDLPVSPTEEFRTLLLNVDRVAETEQDFSRYLGQLGPIATDDATANSEGVRIMTMQSAKGLTVRATIVAAAEDNIIPRSDCDVREERRLLYVGLTRARECLFCTWAQNRIGPTARAGREHIGRRTYSSFLRGGLVQSEDGIEYIRRRW